MIALPTRDELLSQEPDDCEESTFFPEDSFVTCLQCRIPLKGRSRIVGYCNAHEWEKIHSEALEEDRDARREAQDNKYDKAEHESYLRDRKGW